MDSELTDTASPTSLTSWPILGIPCLYLPKLELVHADHHTHVASVYVLGIQTPFSYWHCEHLNR